MKNTSACSFIRNNTVILNMLGKYGLTEAKTIPTPAHLSVKLIEDDGVSKEVNSITYQLMVGNLLYAAMATRPDIAQAVGIVSKFNSKPAEVHLTAVKRILRFPSGTAESVSQLSSALQLALS